MVTTTKPLSFHDFCANFNAAATATKAKEEELGESGSAEGARSSIQAGNVLVEKTPAG
jgi:hypothetical protein